MSCVEHIVKTSFQMSVQAEGFSRRSDIDVIMEVMSLTDSENISMTSELYSLHRPTYLTDGKTQVGYEMTTL